MPSAGDQAGRRIEPRGVLLRCCAALRCCGVWRCSSWSGRIPICFSHRCFAELFQESQKSKNLPLVRTELKKFKDLYESSVALRSLFLNPVITEEARNQALQQVFQKDGINTKEAQVRRGEGELWREWRKEERVAARLRFGCNRC